MPPFCPLYRQILSMWLLIWNSVYFKLFLNQEYKHNLSLPIYSDEKFPFAQMFITWSLTALIILNQVPINLVLWILDNCIKKQVIPALPCLIFWNSKYMLNRSVRYWKIWKCHKAIYKLLFYFCLQELGIKIIFSNCVY